MVSKCRWINISGKDIGVGCCTIYGNWRALRIINEINDNTYVEWYQLPFNAQIPQGQVDIIWNDTIFNKPYHYEYYNLNDDIWQIHNIHEDLDQFHDHTSNIIEH